MKNSQLEKIWIGQKMNLTIVSPNLYAILLYPQTLPVPQQKLRENGHELSKWQLLRILHTLGYIIGKVMTIWESKKSMINKIFYRN